MFFIVKSQRNHHRSLTADSKERNLQLHIFMKARFPRLNTDSPVVPFILSPCFNPVSPTVHPSPGHVGPFTLACRAPASHGSSPTFNPFVPASSHKKTQTFTRPASLRVTRLGCKPCATDIPVHSNLGENRPDEADGFK